MKTKHILFTLFTVLLLSACNNNTPSQDDNLGEVIVEGTFVFTANPCPKGHEPCVPGMEEALKADRVYYLSGVDVSYYDYIYDATTDSQIDWFVLNGDTISSLDSVRISGELHRYQDIHDAYYYRINVSEYEILNR